MVQALFALNERYCINEKGAAAQVETFPCARQNFMRESPPYSLRRGKRRRRLRAALSRSIRSMPTCSAFAQVRREVLRDQAQQRIPVADRQRGEQRV